MKKNTRLLFLIASLAALALLVVMIVAVKSCVEQNALHDFNRTTVLPIPLGAAESEFRDLSDYEREDGFGCYRLDGDGISYTVSGYPDAINAYHTTSVRITDPFYTVYGVRVGEAYPADQLGVMKKFGFTPSDGNATTRKFEQGKLSVTFHLDGITVVGITAALRTTNITEVQF
ncbi:MAG: hypothetical protein IJV98_01345 [Clostridia bacterium]|nr:hypothetical protein [Clostridia bacterium]